MRIRSILCVGMGLAGCAELASRIPAINATPAAATPTSSPTPSKSRASTPSPDGLLVSGSTRTPTPLLTASPSPKPRPTPTPTPKPTPTPVPTPTPTPLPLWEEIATGVKVLHEQVLGIQTGDYLYRRNHPLTMLWQWNADGTRKALLQFWKSYRGDHPECDWKSPCPQFGASFYSMDLSSLAPEAFQLSMPSQLNRDEPLNLAYQYYWLHYGEVQSSEDAKYSDGYTDFTYDSVSKILRIEEVRDRRWTTLATIPFAKLEGVVRLPDWVAQNHFSTVLIHPFLDWTGERLYFSTRPVDKNYPGWPNYWDVTMGNRIAIWQASNQSWYLADNPVKDPETAFSRFKTPPHILVDQVSGIILELTQLEELGYDPRPLQYRGDLYRIERSVIDDAAVLVE